MIERLRELLMDADHQANLIRQGQKRMTAEDWQNPYLVDVLKQHVGYGPQIKDHK